MIQEPRLLPPNRDVLLDDLVAVRGSSLVPYQLGISNEVSVHNFLGFSIVKTLVFAPCSGS